MIYLYNDNAGPQGGVETLTHALATQLERDEIPFQVLVSEAVPCPIFDGMEEQGIDIFRLPRIPGDRWRTRHHLLLLILQWRLEPGDWVYCVRPPSLYLKVVQTVHDTGAKVGVRWSLAPRYRPGSPSFNQAVEETDAVVSTSRCTINQFHEEYGYEGPIHVVRSHNLQFFDDVVPMPKGPPWRIGFMGRIDVEHKNLDTLLTAFAAVVEHREAVEFHLYGGGDVERVESLAENLGVGNHVFCHGRYDHQNDLASIVRNCHFFVYTSRREGGPCFSLLELLQAGRFVVASPVGGIPDLYAGHPNVGRLVPSNDPNQIAKALLDTLQMVQDGDIDPYRIRERYFDDFDMASAHSEWRKVILQADAQPETYFTTVEDVINEEAV
jgi:glycosyltransferase involved in cell wall biosynthesis